MYGTKELIIMKTTGNNQPFNGAEYDNETNTAAYYINGYMVIELDLNTDITEEHDDMSSSDADIYYKEMVKEANLFIEDETNEYLIG